MSKYSFADAAESIAIALSEITKRPVRRDQIIVEPTKNFGESKITIYESSEFANKVIPYLDKFGSIPTTIGELCPIGFETNRKPCKLNLRQHGEVIGESTSGKTSLIHMMLAHATRCPDCIIWIGGVWKLYNFVGPWLEIYRNTGIRPPFGFIAHGHDDVAEMLSAFLKIAYHRMSLPMYERDNLPTMLLFLDEVTFIVENKFTMVDVLGEKINLSQAIARIARGTAEADMFEVLATQRDTQDNLGPEGGTTAAQMGYAFVFRIRDQYTLGRVFNKYSLDQIVNRGEAWADLGPDNPIVRLRVSYPQTDDPKRPVLHNGPKLSQISWARRGIPHVLDAGSAAAAGDFYADRFQYVDDNFLSYLRSVKQASTPSVGSVSGVLPDAGISPEEWAAAENLYASRVQHHMIQNGNGVGFDPNPDNDIEELPEVDTTPTVTDIGQHKTRSSKVQAIIVTNDLDGGSPVSRGEIIKLLERDFSDVVSNPQVVTNILNTLIKNDPPMIAKTDDDRYYSL